MYIYIQVEYILQVEYIAESSYYDVYHLKKRRRTDLVSQQNDV
mgnify:CR=1 FL=1